MSWMVWAALAAGVIALVFAFVRAKWVSAQEVGTEKMAKISEAIRSGAMSYLKRQYTSLIIFVVVVAALLAVGY